MDITPQLDQLSKTLKALIVKVNNRNKNNSKTDLEEEIRTHDLLDKNANYIK